MVKKKKKGKGRGSDPPIIFRKRRTEHDSSRKREGERRERPHPHPSRKAADEKESPLVALIERRLYKRGRKRKGPLSQHPEEEERRVLESTPCLRRSIRKKKKKSTVAEDRKKKKKENSVRAPARYGGPENRLREKRERGGIIFQVSHGASGTMPRTAMRQKKGGRRSRLLRDRPQIDPKGKRSADANPRLM